MMLIGSLGTHKKIHAGIVAKRLEKVEKHFGGHITYLFTIKFHVPHYPRTSAEIHGKRAQALIHRQHKSIAFYAALVAESVIYSCAESYSRIFDGVMFVDMKVAFHPHSKIHA